ncbi:MAG: hypothetical protein QXO01_02470 [Nitrososphaerota archaeon]
MKRGNTLKGFFALLESFFPHEWNENTYIRSPPFLLFKTGSSAILDVDLLYDSVIEHALNNAGMKLIGGNSYFLLIPSVQRTLTMFDWFVRRSWRKAEYVILWSILNLMKGEQECNLSIEQVCMRSGFDQTTCTEVLGLLGIKLDGSKFTISREKVFSLIKELLRTLPSWIEENVMDFVCSNVNISAADVHSYLSCYGLSPSLTYKILRKLKSEGYIRVVRHVRVKSKGPMRELMSSDCRKCFFGYSSPINCFKASFCQLERLVERLMGRPIKMHEAEELYQELSKLPFNEKTLRSVNKALVLALELSKRLKEKNVAMVLRKMGTSLDFKIPNI